MKISYTKDFLKTIQNLKPAQREKLYERIHLCSENPRAAELRNHKLTGEWTGYSSINISGDVRAVFEHIDSGIRFVALGTHSQLYK